MSKSRDIADSAATINYIDTVTSNVQDQIDGKEPADATILKDADIGSTLLGYVAPSTTGNVLTSDGTNWTSAAAGGGGECQVWCYCTMSGSTVTLQNDVGVSSITDEGVGTFVVNLSVTRTSQYYATSASAWTGGFLTRTRPHTSPTTKIWVYFTNTSGTLTDPGFSWSMMSAGEN